MGAFDKTTFTDYGGVRVLHTPSEVDVYTASSLREASVEAVNTGRYHLLVDLSATTYLDPTGMGVLVGMRNRCRSYGGSVRLAGLTEKVANALRITGLAKVFEIVDSCEWSSPRTPMDSTLADLANDHSNDGG